LIYSKNARKSHSKSIYLFKGPAHADFENILTLFLADKLSRYYKNIEVVKIKRTRRGSESGK
jgi:hypothetical protein